MGVLKVHQQHSTQAANMPVFGCVHLQTPVKGAIAISDDSDDEPIANRKKSEGEQRLSTSTSAATTHVVGAHV